MVLNNEPVAVRNIVITGFMGTGKTTVGELVADAVGWRFVDSDEEIVERFGMSIPVIFELHGEEGFRRFESIVAQSLAARSQHVIATGGGMLVDPANLQIMQSSGWVVCLTATPEAIRERLEDDLEGRPLAPNWKKLLNQRQEAYARIPYQIDTTGKSPEQVAGEIIDVWRRSLR